MKITFCSILQVMEFDVKNFLDRFFFQIRQSINKYRRKRNGAICEENVFYIFVSRIEIANLGVRAINKQMQSDCRVFFIVFQSFRR